MLSSQLLTGVHVDDKDFRQVNSEQLAGRRDYDAEPFVFGQKIIPPTS